LIAAGEFIPIAEETGLIADLGVWVLAEACRQIAAWRVEYPDLHISMRVNMSPAQLVMRNIVDVVQNRLEVNNVPGSLLCLEITEHAVVQDKLQAIRVLNELRTLGVTLAIDDFGTGYSSIAQLKQLPVDTLKLDQTFVTGLGKDPKDRAIVDTTIRLANSFGLAVVAEGVETPEVIAELLDLGCYRAQGYLLCKPAAPADLAEILIRGQIDLPAVRTEEAVRSPRHAAR
jgi:EAL domain-containing protein (putative c-di-GMP-specific phosphodiesterase class I)